MELDLKQFPETLRLLQNVVHAVKNKEDLIYKGVYRASILTGIPVNSLQLIKTLTVTKLIEVDRSLIYNTHIIFCKSNDNFPTTEDLYTELQNRLPIYIDVGSFRKMLIQMDYVWKKIREDLLIVIERPQVTYERYHYLTNVTDANNTNSPIYFVTEYYIDKNGKMNVYSDDTETANMVAKFICAITVLYGPKFVEKIDDFNERTFENWMVSNLLPSILIPAVIVVSDRAHHNKKYTEPPTLNSLRIEIIDWLEKHDVPYHIDMSKYELMCLVKQYTDTKANVYKIDNLFKAYGHKILRLPKHLELLTPAFYLAEMLSTSMPKLKEDSNMHLVKYVTSTLPIVEKAKINDIFNFIFKEYKKIMDQDKELDKYWDLYMTNSLTKPAYVDTVLPIFSAEE